MRKNLHLASISALLKRLQKSLKVDSDEQPLSSHSFSVGAALDLSEQGGKYNAQRGLADGFDCDVVS